jgi:hypothetical protein
LDGVERGTRDALASLALVDGRLADGADFETVCAIVVGVVVAAVVGDDAHGGRLTPLAHPGVLVAAQRAEGHGRNAAEKRRAVAVEAGLVGLALGVPGAARADARRDRAFGWVALAGEPAGGLATTALGAVATGAAGAGAAFSGNAVVGGSAVGEDPAAHGSDGDAERHGS